MTARGRQTRAPSPPSRSPYLYRTIKPGAGEPALTKDNAAQSLIGTPITGMGFNCRFSLSPPSGGPLTDSITSLLATRTVLYDYKELEDYQ